MTDLPDMSSLFEQAQKLQSQLLGGQETQTFEGVAGVAGGGAVKVTVTGAGEFTGVTIRPDAVDPNDVAMLEDLVLAAVRDASAQVSAAMQQRLGGLFGGGSAG